MNKNLYLNDSEKEWVLKVRSTLSKPQPPIPTPPNNEIWYTSSNRNVVTPPNSNAFGAKIVSNVYENGIGIITFDGDVTSIGKNAFLGTGLTSITIPDSVTSIRDYAFTSCTGLTSINIPDSVTSIGGNAFYECTSLTSITIPDSVTSIGQYTFFNCTSLSSVIIGNSVTNIGKNAFYNCTSIIVTIPSSVTSIGNDAFYNVLNIEYNGTATGSPWGALNINKYAENGLVYTDSTKTSLIKVSPLLTSITIPDSVENIGDAAFSGCTGLTSITIPNSVTSIGGVAFQNCTSLSSVIIGNSVTNIGNAVFYGCTSLSSITIPNSVTSIGGGTFYECTSLTSITIPDSVTSIGSSAFYGCTELTHIICMPQTPPTLDSDSLPGGNNYTIYVPSESVEAYKGATNWSTYADHIQAIQ